MFRYLVLVSIALGAAVMGSCRERSPEASQESTPMLEDASRAAPEDAGPAPSAEDASAVVIRFAGAVEKGDFEAARADLKMPEELDAHEVDEYLRELRSRGHVSRAGAVAVTQADFGVLGERFAATEDGDKRPRFVAGGYAFGDLEAAAVLQWDGRRFWVVGVYNLASLAPGE